MTQTQTVPAGMTGFIAFSSNGTSLGMPPSATVFPSLTTTALPTGTNSITASFAVSSAYSATVSPATTVSVARGYHDPGGATASPASPTYGQSVTLTQTAPVGMTGAITRPILCSAPKQPAVMRGPASAAACSCREGSHRLSCPLPVRSR